MCGCNYDEGITAVSVTLTLSEPVEGAEIEMRNTLGQSYKAVSDANGVTRMNLPPGVYSASASKTEDNGYTRKVYNGNMVDIVVSGGSMELTLPVTISTVETNNPILIKEIYVGGCQKDDGSGWFAIDKCIILYNNSSEAASLDNVCFGIIEPYNAEASVHSFLSDGKLEYADSDIIPSINGIWYFQPGHIIEPYSEVVVNIYGAIDNTLTYSQSVNYADARYYTMYDPESTSADGGKYNNTNYYPSPSETIPTSHYLKAVKYGQSNVWPISMFSPAIILFRTEGTTPAEFAGDTGNIIYPADKQGNLIYACLQVPRKWVLDAVEVFNANNLEPSRKRLTPDLDGGYALHSAYFGHSLTRRVERMENGHPIYQDTNNSSNDFYEAQSCSLR